MSDVIRRLEVSGSFTATGVSQSTYMSEADFLLSGTFEATIVVEIKESKRDNWAPACEFTEPGVHRLLLARGHQTRVRCSAYTSGTALYALESKTDYLSER